MRDILRCHVRHVQPQSSYPFTRALVAPAVARGGLAAPPRLGIDRGMGDGGMGLPRSSRSTEFIHPGQPRARRPGRLTR